MKRLLLMAWIAIILKLSIYNQVEFNPRYKVMLLKSHSLLNNGVVLYQ
jgi:hypothetical protein